MVWLRVRRWVVRPIFWLLVVLAVAALALAAYLRSDAFRQRLAVFLEGELRRVVGREVTIGAIELDLLPSRLVLRDLSIPGATPEEPPFLEAREVAIDVDADALRRDLVDIQTIVVRGLSVRIRLNKDGTDNLPDFPPAAAAGSRFVLRIGGLYVEESEIELDDRRVPLDLKARAVMVRLAGLGGTRLQGNVVAQEIETTLAGARPWPATLAGSVRIEGDRVDILEARLASAYLSGRAHGSIGWKGGTHGEIDAALQLDGRWLDERGWLKGEIAGVFDVDGLLRFARRDVRIEGDLRSSAANLFGFDVAALEGRVEGNLDRLALAIRRAEYRGAPLTGTLDIELAGEEERGHLVLASQALPVRELLGELDLPDFRVASTAAGELTFDFPFSAARRGRGGARFELRAARDRAGVPADGFVEVALADGAIEIRDLTLKSAGGLVHGSGNYDLLRSRGAFAVHVSSTDLSEVARLQPFVELEPKPVWLPTEGSGEIDAEVRLAAGATVADLRFDLASPRAPGLVADRARGRLSVTPDRVDDLDLELERGAARLHAAGGMPFGGQKGGGALEVVLEAWPVEDAEAWTGLDLPLAGPANGRLALRGTLDELAGELAGTVSPVAVAGFDAEALDVALTWEEKVLTVSRAVLTSPAGALSGGGTLGFGDGALDLQVATAGDGLDLAAPPFLDLWGERLGGRLALEAKIGGTTAAPALDASGRVASLRLLDRELGEGGVANLQASLHEGALAIDFELPELVRLRGGGAIEPGKSADLTFDLATAKLGRWLELATATELPEVGGELHATLAVRQAAGGPLTAVLEADRIDLTRGGRALALLEPARVLYDGERVAVESLFFGDRDDDGEIFVGGAIRLAEPTALDLNVQAEASVDWIEEWTGLDFDGRLELLSKIGGTLDKPEWNGEAALTGGRFIPPRIPHTVDRLQATALFYPEAIVLDSARGDFAGGKVSAFGRIDLPHAIPGGLSPLDYRFQLVLESAAVRYPEGFLLRGGGELTLQATAEGRQLRGEIDLSRLDYVQDINLSPAQIVQRFLTRTRLTVEETDDFLSSTYLAVAVEAPGALRVRNNLARIDGGVELSVRGTLANPVLFGEVTTVAGGTIEYNGATYELERGALTFVNPSRIVPIVDFVATTRIDDYDVRLTVGGSLDRLSTSFSSNPPLPEYDVLALLATGAPTGETTFGGSSGDSGAPAQAAESLLYGQAASLIGARVGTLFGVDRLRIDPLTTGDSVSAARVSVGKRLSRKVYVTYSVDPSSTAQQVLEVEWKLSDDVTLVLTQNGDGSYAVDTRWGRKF